MRKRREAAKQQEIEQHIKLQKDDDMKKRQMTMEKLTKADEMVMSALTKKQQDIERKQKMEK